MQRGGWQHKNTLNLAANPTVFFGPQRAYMLWCLLRVEEDLDWRENVLNRHGAHS